MAEAQGHRSVLFVCLGNICRSPMAEIVMRAVVQERGLQDHWHIDSAGTSSYHIGDRPDERTVDTCRKNLGKKMPAVAHKARQISTDDFHKFDYILCMDHENLGNLQRIQPKGARAIVKLLGSFDPEGHEVIEDPYYGGMDGFQFNFHQCMRSCNSLIDHAK